MDLTQKIGHRLNREHLRSRFTIGHEHKVHVPKHVQHGLDAVLVGFSSSSDQAMVKLSRFGVMQPAQVSNWSRRRRRFQDH